MNMDEVQKPSEFVLHVSVFKDITSKTEFGNY
jgi:hypothetical protein